jgi:hypothetical protein
METPNLTCLRPPYTGLDLPAHSFIDLSLSVLNREVETVCHGRYMIVGLGR